MPGPRRLAGRGLLGVAGVGARRIARHPAPCSRDATSKPKPHCELMRPRLQPSSCGLSRGPTGAIASVPQVPQQHERRDADMVPWSAWTAPTGSAKTKAVYRAMPTTMLPATTAVASALARAATTDALSFRGLNGIASIDGVGGTSCQRPDAGESALLGRVLAEQGAVAGETAQHRHGAGRQSPLQPGPLRSAPCLGPGRSNIRDDASLFAPSVAHLDALPRVRILRPIRRRFCAGNVASARRG